MPVDGKCGSRICQNLMREFDKIILITGGTSGIGLGIGQVLASIHTQNCAFVLSFAGNEERAKEAKEKIETTIATSASQKSHPDIDPKELSAVVTVKRPLFGPDDCEYLVNSCRETFGRDPDILINCAGRIRDGLFLGSTFSDHMDHVNEHLIVPMCLSHLVLKSMYRRKWGRIINLSSISAQFAKRGQVNYAAAKAGIEGFTRTLALEVARRGITVNAIAPGLVATPMTEQIIAKLKEEKLLKRKIPAGYAADANDIGQLVSFLCQEQARYITGQTLTIDGGRSLGDSSS